MAHLGAMLGFLAPLGAALGDLGRLLGSRMLPRRPRSLPDPSQTSIFIDFATMFGRISVFFYCFFQVFLARFLKLQILSSSALKIGIGTVAALRAQRTGYPPAPGTGVLNAQCQDLVKSLSNPSLKVSRHPPTRAQTTPGQP